MAKKNAKRKPANQDMIGDADVEQLSEALARVRNPAVRYFLCMMIDALTEDLAEIEAGRPPRILTRSRSN
ncbi:MAG TPA: hypothetical protein VG891_11685 [Rhizomicrobium sp.]|nr:hypothetical protein [Rhizomicrobium sp.]